MTRKLDYQKFNEIIDIYRDYLEKSIPLELPHYMTLDISQGTLTLAVFENDRVVGSMMRYSIDGSGLWDDESCSLNILRQLADHMLNPKINTYLVRKITRSTEEVLPF